MPKKKVDVTVTIEADHKEWLEKVAVEHGLPDLHKALRCLLDFAISEVDEEKIFDEIRCLHC